MTCSWVNDEIGAWNAMRNQVEWPVEHWIFATSVTTTTAAQSLSVTNHKVSYVYVESSCRTGVGKMKIPPDAELLSEGTTCASVLVGTTGRESDVERWGSESDRDAAVVANVITVWDIQSNGARTTTTRPVRAADSKPLPTHLGSWLAWPALAADWRDMYTTRGEGENQNPGTFASKLRLLLLL